jgi:hypothetical protein
VPHFSVKSASQRQRGEWRFSIAFTAAFCAFVLISIAQGRAQRIPASLVPDRASTSGCPRNQLLNFEILRNGEVVREVAISQLPDSSAFFFEAGMTIDADGAPNAYHPDNRGLDDLANAGESGNWQGLAHDSGGEPYVQGPDDPFPGYFVSTTALSDRSKSAHDPSRYVDASRIPYIVLPRSIPRQLGARLGDFAVVFNLRNGKSSYAIFADVGPAESIGEGSIALAENLGIWSDARRGGTRGGIVYLVFPGSGNGRPRSIGEIYDQSERLFQAWGGADQFTACSKR